MERDRDREQFIPSISQTPTLKWDELPFGGTYRSPFTIRVTWKNSLDETPTFRWLNVVKMNSTLNQYNKNNT